MTTQRWCPPPSTHRPAIPGGPQTVGELLADRAARTPDAPAVVGASARYSYGELDATVDAAAGALWSFGVRPGDRVAASLPNDASIVVAFLATMRLGAIWVGMPRALSLPEKRFQLDDCRPVAVLAEPSVAAALEPERSAVPGLRHVVAVGPGADGEWHDAVRAELRCPVEPVDPFAPAAISYTSGTTGRPKGVVHSQHNLLVPGAVLAGTGAFTRDEPQGVVHQLTILNLMVLGPLVAFQAGAPCVVIPEHDPATVARWVQQERVATMSLVPTLYHDLLTNPDIDPESLVTLTKPRAGGSYPSEALRALFLERFGVRVTTSYALTEAPTLVTRESPDSPVREGNLGHPLPHLRLHILDRDDRELPVGETGEICVGASDEGPWAGVYTPMLGYWNLREESEAALRGGILHTGDVGRLEPDGSLVLVDRKSSLIIRGGSNVYPAEIEHVLQQHPGVAECVVVAKPDDRLGERIVAVVRPADPELDVSSLRARCDANLARYKIPDEFTLVDDFPRSALGKVQRDRLRRQVAEDAASPEASTGG